MIAGSGGIVLTPASVLSFENGVYIVRQLPAPVFENNVVSHIHGSDGIHVLNTTGGEFHGNVVVSAPE